MSFAHRAAGAPMSAHRRAFLSLVFLSFIAGSLYDIVRNEEHWPFSQYPMFSGVWRAPSFTWFRLVGVTASGNEFPLDDNRYIRPFDQSRLPKALRTIANDSGRAPRLKEALRNALTRYAELGRNGSHDGPSLVAMRLYEIEWTIDPAAANVHRPDRRRLVAEVQR
jgi:hypothetical protein